MRFTPFIAWAVLAYGTVADDAQKVLNDESSSSLAESATSSADASIPTFTVSSLRRPRPQPRNLRRMRERANSTTAN